MSYADAAGKGTNYRQYQNDRYYNEKMVVCSSRGITLEKLAEALHKKEMLPPLSAIQKIRYGVMYALVVENPEVRKDLVVQGLDVGGIHLSFNYHNMDMPKVCVSNIPCGISLIDLRRVFDLYSIITDVQKIKKSYYGFQLDTGDRIITFEKLTKPIPSYVHVRGWLAYVKYKGQVQTCRHCGQGGHTFANCQSKNGKGTRPEERSRNEEDAEPGNMDVHEPPPPNQPDVPEEEIQSTPSMQVKSLMCTSLLQKILYVLMLTKKY